jgi:hypothetical protein
MLLNTLDHTSASSCNSPSTAVCTLGAAFGLAIVVAAFAGVGSYATPALRSE